MKISALIPARSGSKRVINKNIRMLGNKPLIKHTLDLVEQCNFFDSSIVSSDSNDILKLVSSYDGIIPLKRPKNISGDRSPDIDWVIHALNELESRNQLPDIIFILRPTSPFRTVNYLERALKTFKKNQPSDSLRGVDKVDQHPGKMWIINKKNMTPLLSFKTEQGVPWHSSQYQSLPEVYVQNASIEIAWTNSIRNSGSISGEIVLPFISSSIDSFDINSEKDFSEADNIIKDLNL